MAGAEREVSGRGSVTPESEEARRVAEDERAKRARRKQALELQRENILGQRTSNAGRRAALEAALKSIEAEIAALG